MVIFPIKGVPKGTQEKYKNWKILKFLKKLTFLAVYPSTGQRYPVQNSKQAMYPPTGPKVPFDRSKVLCAEFLQPKSQNTSKSRHATTKR